MSRRFRTENLLLNVDSPFAVTILACFVFALSYAAALLGGSLLVRPEMVWPLWPGCAFLVAVLLLTPRRIWPVLLLAGFLGFIVYDIQESLPARTIALLLASDTVEVVVAALGVSYFLGTTPRLNSITSLGVYLLFSVFLGSLPAGFIGAIALRGEYWRMWAICFLTEALALLTITPAIFGWISRRRAVSYYIEAATLTAVLAILAYFTFVASIERGSPLLLYALVPLLLWSALRFGTTGVASSMVVVAFLSIWGAVRGVGLFTLAAPLSSVFSLQVFLLIAAIPFMVLAAIVEDRQDTAQSLRESETRFRLLADTAPVLIWMSDTNKLCTYFNKPWLDFTGRSIDREIGNGWAEGVHGDDVERCLQTYIQAFDRRESFRMQYRLRRHDLEYRWILDIGVPRFNDDGSFLGYIGVGIDVTEQKLAEKALADVSRKMVAVQEEERRRIARDLHDDINQRLAILAVELQQLGSSPPNSPGDIARQLTDIRERLIEISTGVQSISYHLHSPQLEYLGIVAAMRAFCKDFAARHAAEIDFKNDDIPNPIAREVSLCLFRVLQEALHNAAQHSKVKHFEVRLGYSASQIDLTVSDRGAGFDIGKAMTQGGLGLISMRERVRLVNGRIVIDSKPMGGTRIYVRTPIESVDLSGRAIG
jgi:PAS domain S-box-containing protein